MPGIIKEVPATGRLQRIDRGTDWSSGDLSSGGQTALNVAGKKADIRDGTSASPIATVAPTVKVSRQETITRAAIAAVTGSPTSDAAAGLAAINGSSAGSSSTEAQTVGVFGGATNASNASGTNVQADACGVYGNGRISGGSAPSASCYGGVFNGRRDVDTAVVNGVEIQCQNFTATAESYTPAAPFASGKARGIWLVPGGTADSSCGLAINNPFGVQFEVGIGFGSLVAGGKTGGVKLASIRDDSHADVSLDIRGTHAVAAMTVANGSGPVVIGAQALSGTTSQLLELHAGGVSRNPMLRLAGGGSVSQTIVISSTAGSFVVGQAGSANALMTGTAAGDGAIYAPVGKVVHLGTVGSAADIRVGGGIGFYGTAPQAKPTGVAVTAAGIHAALVSLGLIAA